MKQEEKRPLDIEELLRSKFVKVQPDANFIDNLSERLKKKSMITLEQSRKFFYYLAIGVLSLFSGLFLFWGIKKIIKSEK